MNTTHICWEALKVNIVKHRHECYQLMQTHSYKSGKSALPVWLSDLMLTYEPGSKGSILVRTRA